MNRDGSSSGQQPFAPAQRTAPEVHSITDATQAHSDDMDARIKRYLWQMGLRVACLPLVFFIHSPIRWVFGVLAVILPYIAVVMANATSNRRGSGPKPVPAARVPLARGASPEQPNPQSHERTA